jgi:hypothetical protein
MTISHLRGSSTDTVDALANTRSRGPLASESVDYEGRRLVTEIRQPTLGPWS